jgi:hypothetical protein
MQTELSDDRPMPSVGPFPDACQCGSGGMKHRIVEPIGCAIEVAGVKIPLAEASAASAFLRNAVAVTA